MIRALWATLRRHWPWVSRRRLRVAEQLAARALLGRRALAADKADLAAEIGRLNRTLADAEPVIRLHKGEAKRLEGRVRELEGRLECQADNHEADRAEWARKLAKVTGERDDALKTIQALLPAPGGLEQAWDDTVTAGLGVEAGQP